jgi:hypothetical protein
MPHLNQQLKRWLYLPYNFSAGCKKCISTGKKVEFANTQFAVKA